MRLRNNKTQVIITLVLFFVMVCFNPVYAHQPQFPYSELPTQISIGKLPVTYVSDDESEQFAWEIQRQGFIIRKATISQLAELQLRISNSNSNSANDSVSGVDENSVKGVPAKPECNHTKNKDNSHNETIAQDNKITKDKTTDCEVESNKQDIETFSPAQDLPPPAPPLQPQTSVQTHVGIHANVSYGSGGGKSESGKVFFIIAGVFVVAAFIVYAGKYVSDLVAGKDQKLWWEVIFNSTFLDAGSGQRGDLLGVKIGTGIVSSELIQVALITEMGQANLDLILNEFSTPTPFDISTNYWLLGATARLHLTDKLVNASYLYLDFMGGGTSNSATDTIGMARMGASFGINDTVRVGANLGALYIGLDKDKGFINDGDNYWITYGIEMGVKF